MYNFTKGVFIFLAFVTLAHCMQARADEFPWKIVAPMCPQYTSQMTKACAAPAPSGEITICRPDGEIQKLDSRGRGTRPVVCINIKEMYLGN